MKKLPKAIPKRSPLAEMSNVEILPGNSPLLLFPPVKKPTLRKPRTNKNLNTPKAQRGEKVAKVAKTSSRGITSSNIFGIFVDQSQSPKETVVEHPAKKQKSEMPTIFAEKSFSLNDFF